MILKLKSLLQLTAILLIATGAFGAENKKPMYFQAEKNNLQVLPQKFEYLLIDSERIKLGDLLIDSSLIRFQILFPKETKDYFRIRFSWPVGLFDEGEVILFNNYGKSMWSSVIDKTNLKIIKNQNLDFKTLRSDLAEFTTGNIDKSIFDDMKYLPFMKFCITRTDRHTRIDLCSRELFLSSKDGQLVIKIREANKKQASITINEKEVKGDQGLIFLNDPKENIAFRATSESGATLDIETRMRPVDFRDATFLTEGKTFQVIAEGARPVEQESVVSINNNMWKKEIPVEQPLVYLRGEGDIPMRQEFYVRGTLPDEKYRPFIELNSPERTYQSSLKIRGTSAAETKLTQVDKNSVLKDLGNSQFEWLLEDLKPGETNKRYLGVEAKKGKFQASHQVFRGLNKGLALGARYLTPAQTASGSVELEWWFEKFLYLSSSPFVFHWGANVSMDQALSAPTGTTKLSQTQLQLKYRINQGLHLEDPTFGVALGFNQLKGDGVQASYPHFGGFYHRKYGFIFADYFDWWQHEFLYSPGGGSDSFKVKSWMQLKSSAISLVRQRHQLSAGIVLSQTQIDGSTEPAKLQFGPEFKYQFRF